MNFLVNLVRSIILYVFWTIVTTLVVRGIGATVANNKEVENAKAND